jgi:ElaA protein
MHVPGSKNEIVFQCLHFQDLDTYTLYELMKLRQAVFCVEQECPYQDLDDKDQLSWHLLGYQRGELVAVARLIMPGESYPDACSIGRVATRKDVRKEGLGRALMQRAIECCENQFPAMPIRISAQQYLRHFYQSLGFAVQGEGYLEDGIAHILMLRS